MKIFLAYSNPNIQVAEIREDLEIEKSIVEAKDAVSNIMEDLWKFDSTCAIVAPNNEACIDPINYTKRPYSFID